MFHPTGCRSTNDFNASIIIFIFIGQIAISGQASSHSKVYKENSFTHIKQAENRNITMLQSNCFAGTKQLLLLCVLYLGPLGNVVGHFSFISHI